MINEPTISPDEAEKRDRPSVVTRLAVLIALAAAAVWIYQNFGHHLTLDALAQRESQLRAYQNQHPILIYGAAFATYVTVAGLSLPFAGVMSLVFAWFFGFWPALLLISFASTAGATFAFLTSRYLFRDHLQAKFSERFESFNTALQEEGAFYLFTLRLIPAVPFVVINIVMGLTPMKARTFWWVSQIGMLPGTAVYVYAGSRFPDLKTLADKGASGILTPQLIVAFGLLGIFPLMAKHVLAKLRPATTDA